MILGARIHVLCWINSNFRKALSRECECPIKRLAHLPGRTDAPGILTR